MIERIDNHVFTGMQRDKAISKLPAEFLWEAHNIRLTAREGDTLLSVTNEKGTKQLTLVDSAEQEIQLRGVYVGHCVLNLYLVLFTTDALYLLPYVPPPPPEESGNSEESGVSEEPTNSNEPPNSNESEESKEAIPLEAPEILNDFIYRIEYNASTSLYIVKTLFSGNLSFSKDNPIETLGIFENENIQKVYWVDGKNLPRVINIINDTTVENPSYDPYAFVLDLQLNEEVSITKQERSTGLFPAGTVLYAITYYNKYGQESNIVWTSCLLYTSLDDRAGSPEENSSNTFTLSIQNWDNRFDYIRLYSIVRSSWNGEPIVRRIVDLELNSSTPSPIVYTDTNTHGEIIDKSLLLYVGGENIIADCLTLKDGTLFLGNIKLQREGIDSTIKLNFQSYKNNLISALDRREVYYDISNDAFGNPKWLTCYPHKAGERKDTTNLTNPAYFKTHETYRFGILLQYKTGKWSEPIFLKDLEASQDVASHPGGRQDAYGLPMFQYSFYAEDIAPGELKGKLKDYKKVRGVVVIPTETERRAVAQGILCPTVYSMYNRTHNSPFAQSSWFLRPFSPLIIDDDDEENTISFPTRQAIWLANDEKNLVEKGAIVLYHHLQPLFHTYSRGAELSNSLWIGDVTLNNSISTDSDGVLHGTVLVKYENNSHDIATKYVELSNCKTVFAVDLSIVTFHSPEIEFNDNLNIEGASLQVTGYTTFTKNYGDISILVSSPPMGTDSAGFLHKDIIWNSETDTTTNLALPRSLVSGFFFRDVRVLEVDNDTYSAGEESNNKRYFMVYPWQKLGSLNNDATRPAGTGTQTALLKRKVISNIKYSSDSTYLGDSVTLDTSDIKVFDSDLVEVLMLNYYDSNDNVINKAYYGNVDTIVLPDILTGTISTVARFTDDLENIDASFAATAYNMDRIFEHWYLSSIFITGTDETVEGSYKDARNNDNAFARYSPKDASSFIRMKYKSPKHIVACLHGENLESIALLTGTDEAPFLLIADLLRPSAPDFGGTSEAAIMQNLWIPAGEPVDINFDEKDELNVEVGKTKVDFIYGDTFFQRYDCLKTAPFSNDDENSIVEIGSVMLETRINLAGRYDRNKGLTSNLYINKENFNKINTAYSLQNNFFNYRLLDSDFYNLNSFSNAITWTKSKTSGDKVDAWTNITMASTLDLDGTKGTLTALSTANDKIIAFLEKGISEILFNSRVQIPTSDNNPIEISNNYKVDGYRNISDTVGVSNKWTIVKGSNGLYFIDSLSGQLYLLGEGINDLSTTKGFSYYFSTLDTKNPWTINNYTLKSFYDNLKHDLYISNKDESLVYSETLGEFTSFMSYGNVPAMFNLNSNFYALYKDSIQESQLIVNPDNASELIEKEVIVPTINNWLLFAGDYNCFFGKYKPFDITFVSNADSIYDKTFSTIDTRTDFYSDEVSLEYSDNKVYDAGKEDKVFDLKRESNAEELEDIHPSVGEHLPKIYLRLYNGIYYAVDVYGRILIGNNILPDSVEENCALVYIKSNSSNLSEVGNYFFSNKFESLKCADIWGVSELNMYFLKTSIASAGFLYIDEIKLTPVISEELSDIEPIINLYGLFSDKLEYGRYSRFRVAAEGGYAYTTLAKFYENLLEVPDNLDDINNSILQNNMLFDYIRVQNEYQDTGKVTLNHKNVKPSNIKKKFRIWRIQIPRDNKLEKAKLKDRIRNPWTKITLGMYDKLSLNVPLYAENGETLNSEVPVLDQIVNPKLYNNTKMIMHDINVLYFI